MAVLADEMKPKVQKLLYKSPDSGIIYRIAIHTDGSLGCDCPHFQFRLRRTKGRCKHIEAFVEERKGWERMISS